MAWNTRFKAASAARRRTADGVTTPQVNRVSGDDVALARQISPCSFLLKHYPDVQVNKRGDSIVIEDVLRADKKLGTWVSCDWLGGAIGDNIALAQWVKPELEFRDAVRELLNLQTPTMPTAVGKVRNASSSVAMSFPKLPASAGEVAGRAYLHGRGISDATIDAAVNAGALGWCESGVLFLGRDHSSPDQLVRAATIRYFAPMPGAKGKMVAKRDLADSDKSFPVLFPGDPARVVVAEGGVTGLAAQEMALLRGEPVPTVIVTGGANIRGWLSANLPLRGVVVAAERVDIIGENEVDRDGCPAPLKQMRTDSARQHLVRLVAEARDGEIPDTQYPPSGIKDAAEWLQALMADDLPPC